MARKKTYGTTASGKPITDELVAELAKKAEAGYNVEETLRRRPGRPALGSAPASVGSVRLDPELREALLQRASRDDQTTSSVIRKALRRYLEIGELTSRDASRSRADQREGDKAATRSSSGRQSLATDNKSSRTSPASTTGGAGFAFEDYVGAWFAAALLAGASPLGPRFGAVAAVRFQASQPLDDIVVTAATHPPRTWSASIKSFDMLRGRKLEGGFATAAWKELTRSGFNWEQDFVGFASGPVAEGNWRALEELISTAEKDSPAGLAARIKVPRAFNQVDRDLWTSAVPQADSISAGEDPSTAPARLLERLIPRTFDFRQADSTSVVQAKEWCRDALAAGQEATPDELWIAICRRVAEVRPTGGSVDWQSLMRALPEFSFALRPDAAPDWQVLDQHTDSALASVRDHLGGGLRLPRAEAWGTVQTLASETPVAYLTGPSGCGKTALAKRWVQEPSRRGLWLNAYDLERGLAAFGAQLRLRLGLVDALRLTNRPLRIVIDGLDRSLRGRQFEAAAELIRTAADSEGRIQVLIPVQQLAFEGVTARLHEHNAALHGQTISIENFDRADIAAVLEARPTLRRVVYQGQLQSVLRRPKLLQVVLDTMGTADSESLGTLRDEADVADLWWLHLARGTENQTHRGELLLGLASTQADGLVDATPAGGLRELAPHASAADALRQDGILESDERRFAFSHDLFGDWSRYQELQGRDQPLDVIAVRSTLPPWHHAIRLYALALLQRSGPDDWRDQHARLRRDGHWLASDLYLDAPLFASNADVVLEALWPTLVAEDGGLLNRFLGRFRHVATAPDPRGSEIFPDAPDIAAYWAATSRIPLVPLWGPVVRLLHAHASEAIDLAPVQVAAVADLWLRLTPTEWPLRNEAADVALALGESLASGPLSEVYFHDESDSKLWHAVLAAGGQKPDAVVRLCERLLHTDDEVLEAEDEDFPVDDTSHNWRQEGKLREALLDNAALVPLMQANPELAHRVLLKGMLTPPRRRDSSLFDRRETLGITDEPHWLGPVPERGPLRAFLNIAPLDALATVVEATEHATERWRVHADHQGDGEAFEIYRGGGWARLVGDAEVMHWHRGNTFVPSVLAAGLMAVEAHVYRKLDEGEEEEIEPLLSRLLKSDSVAVIGLLASVACYRPSLLTDSLSALATSAGLLLSDKLYKAQPHTDLLIPTIGEAAFADRIREWQTMPHRDTPLWWLVMSYVLSGNALVDEVAAARARWLQDDGESWRHLAAQLDPANYETKEVDGREYWSYVAPPELQAEIDTSDDELAASTFWLTGPHKLRQWIDGQVEPSHDEVARVWDEWHERLGSIQPDREIPAGIRSRADLETGLAAFFVLRAPDWLSTDDEKRAWCRNALLAPFADPPPTHEFDSSLELSGDRWDGFAADAIPALWADTPDDPELRNAVVALAVHRHRETVRRLFDAVAARSALKDDLLRLERVSLQWARYTAWRHEKRHREELASYGDDFGAKGPGVEDLPDVETPTRAILDMFVRRELPAESPALLAFISETPDGMMGRRVGPRDRAFSVIDVEYLIAAFAHLLVLSDGLDASERERRFRFAGELATFIGDSLVPNEGNDEVNGTPYQVEWNLLDVLGQMTVEASLDEARQIWQPIVARGIPADHWVEAFLRGMWRAAIAQSSLPLHFEVMIKELLAFASQCETWRSGAGWPRDIETTIVGLDGYTVRELREDHAGLIESLQPEWSDWVAARVSSFYFARNVAAFLKGPAASPVIDQGLEWLAERERRGDRVDERLDETLGELLNQLAARSPELFARQDDPGESVRTILAGLAARQRPIALELMARFG